MPERSAGILFHRRAGDGLQVLLVHPGGPFWRNKDQGAWQIPKGLIEHGESAEVAARREAGEELGIAVEGDLVPLACFKQAGGKIVEAFAVEQNIDPACVASNTFEMEWPPRSGTVQRFPEIDKAAWFAIDDARQAMLASQRLLLDRLQDLAEAELGTASIASA